MNKRKILSTALVLMMCLCTLSFPAFASITPTVSADYSNGIVSISGTGYKAQTDYIVRIVDTDNSSLTAMTQTTAKSNGNLSVSVTTGTLGTLSNYTAYVNGLDGVNAASAVVKGKSEGSGSGSSSSGSSSHHHSSHHHSSNSGSTTGVPAAPSTPSLTFISDTTTNFTVRGSYQFKITSKDGKKPAFVIGTPGVFTTQFIGRSGNDYFFKITAVGASGSKAGIYVNGQKLLVAAVGSTALGNVQCDTTLPFKIKAGASYTFKLTAKSKPTFVCGNGSVFAVSYAGQKNNNYFFKAKAVGKTGNCAGFYINESKVPCTVSTVS